MNENGLQGNDGGTNKFGNHDSFGNEASNQINEGSNDLHVEEKVYFIVLGRD